MNVMRRVYSAVVGDGEGAASRASLLADDRGVIMVVGVFFTFFWIGMVWFLFGVGNAIAYRENMQNAADSAAFAGAVYNARGMNLIAVINNLMGVVLATLIVMKIAQIVNLFAKGADCHEKEDVCLTDLAACLEVLGGEVLCAESVESCPAAVAGCISDCDSVMDWITKLSNYDKEVHTMLQGMHDVEAAVALGWPYLSIGKASLGGDAPNFFASGVVSTTAYAYAMNFDSKNKSASACGSTSDGPCAQGPRCGLPVTSDHYSSLCKVAINDFFTVGGVIPSHGILGTVTGLGTEAVYDLMGEWLCDDHTQTGAAYAANEAFTVGGTLALSVLAFWECTLANDIEKAITGLLFSGGGVTAGKLSLIPMSGTDVPNNCPAWSPMAIYAPATMGLDYFAVWGGATGTWTTAFADFAATPVQIAGIRSKSESPTVVVAAPSDASTAVSKAEFYYEPYGSPGTVASYDNITAETTVKFTQLAAQNVMWNMRWRARLRRWHFMPLTAYVTSFMPGSGAGYSGELTYLSTVIGDTDLITAMLWTGSLPIPHTANVDNYTNDPPFAMYH